MASDEAGVDMGDFFRDFRWVDDPPWASPESQAHKMGIDVARAGAALARLYPPDFCEAMARDGRQSLILGLFLRDVQWMPQLEWLMFLGADLAECDGWLDDADLVGKLRNPDNSDAARFEVGVWAGLRRVGLAVEHEPAAEHGRKVADLVVVEGARRIAIEVKAVYSAKRERNAYVLDEAVSLACAFGGFMDYPKHTTALHPSQSVLADVETLEFDQFRSKYSRLVHESVLNTYRRDAVAVARGGRFSLGDLGDLEVTADTEWHSSGVEGVEEKGFVHDIQRALRTHRQARLQVAGYSADVRAVVIRVPSRRIPVEHVHQVLHVLIGRDREKYEGIDALQLVNVGWHESGSPTRSVLWVPPWADPEIQSMRWPKGVVNWREMLR